MDLQQERADILFSALGDATRRALFQRIAQGGEQSVHALTEGSGVSQPMVSRHLAVLKKAGLVNNRREGRETFYRSQPQALAPLTDWITHYSAFWEERFDGLETLLARMDQ